MAGNIGELNVAFGMKGKPFFRGIDKAGKSVTTFKKQIGAGSKALRTFVGVGSTLLATGLFAKMIRGNLETVDALGKTSDKLGIATENLVGFQHAAELTGVSVNTANLGLQRMVRRVAEAAQGTGEAKKALAELNLNAAELAQLSPDEQFAKVADAMAAVGNQSDKVRLSMKLFDSEGVSLVNTLALGSEGLADMTREAERLGLAISRTDARKIEAANDSFTRVNAALTGVGRRITVELAAPLEAAATTAVNMFFDVSKSADGAGASISGVGAIAIKVLGAVGDAAQGFGLIFKGVKVAFRSAQAGFDEMINGLDKESESYKNAIAAQEEFAKAREDASISFSTRLEIEMQAIKNRTRIERIGAEQRKRNHKEREQAVIKSATDVISGIKAILAEQKAAGQTEEARIWQQVKVVDQAEAAKLNIVKDYQGLRDQLVARVIALRKQQANEERQNTLAQARNILENQSDLVARHAEEVKAIEAMKDQDGITGRIRYLTTLRALEAQHEEERLANQEQWDQIRMRKANIFTQAWIQGEGERARRSKMHWTAQAQTALQSIETITAGAAQSNKTMFRINKMAATANAIVNTAQGVTKALATYPPPLSFVMAGLVGAAGAAQIGAIQGQSFGGGGGATPVSSSGGALAAAGDTPNAGQGPGGALTGTGRETAGTINVVIQGKPTDTVTNQQLYDALMHLHESGRPVPQPRWEDS